MKVVFASLALVLAAPAVAQTAPTADPHAGHAQHQQGGQAQHQQGGHADHGAMHGDHAKMDCCKDGKHKECCDKMKQQGSAMACCKDKPAAAPAKSAEPSAHEGHEH